VMTVCRMNVSYGCVASHNQPDGHQQTV